MQKTRVWSLDREDPLEKEMVTHSSILAWRIPWTEKPGRLQSMGSQRVGHDWAISLTHSLTVEKVTDFIFFGSKITADGDYSHDIKRCLLLGRKAMINLKSRDITLPTKVRLVKAMVFPVVMSGWELDHKESWAPKNCCFWTVVLEKTLESPLDCREIKVVNSKGNLSWIFIGRTEAEAPIL